MLRYFMKVPEASCYPQVLFSELYGATFRSGKMGKEQGGKKAEGWRQGGRKGAQIIPVMDGS